MYAFLFSVTDIQAAAYLEPSRVIDQTLMPVENYFTKLTDRRNSSCLYMNLNRSRWLQAIFKFHESVIDHEIDVEIVGKNSDDCAAVSWTWFAESSCIPGSFMECQKLILESNNDGDYSRCIATCACRPTCDYVYLKYMHVPSGDQSELQLCDVYLLYHGDVKPKARGLLPQQ